MWGAAGVKKDFVIWVGQYGIQIRRVFLHTMLRCQLLEFVSIATREDRIRHDALITADQSTLLPNGEDGAHEMLIGAHASGDAVHDDADVACFHKCSVLIGIL